MNEWAKQYLIKSQNREKSHDATSHPAKISITKAKMSITKTTSRPNKLMYCKTHL